MRLYLSSYQFGEQTDQLVALAGRGVHTGIIVNASDNLSADIRKEHYEEQAAALRALGFEAEELDLRNYFQKPKALEEQIVRFGLIWVRGGNAFVLKRAMEQSGFDKLLPNLLKKDQLAYGGFSAGVVVLCPSLKGIELCDSANDVPPGYSPVFRWEGLGLLPYAVVPHYRSNHPESPIMEEIVALLEKDNLPYKTLRDDEVIIIDEDLPLLLH